MCTGRRTQKGQEEILQPSHCEATILTTAPPCHNLKLTDFILWGDNQMDCGHLFFYEITDSANHDVHNSCS